MRNTAPIAESVHRITIASIGFRACHAIILFACCGLFNNSLAQSPASSASTGEAGPIVVTAGQSVFGKNGFIEYVMGNLPIVISVPHGGYLKPSTIPNRVLGTAGHQDTNTQELAREIIELFRTQTGKVPHVIINRLHRDKLDANRELFDAAQDDPIATEAWNEFHSFIDIAEHRIQQEFGRGLYIDLHGHRHDWQVVELGYLLVSNQLKLSDAELDASVQLATTSLGLILNDRTTPLSQLVRGPRSLGAALEQEGFTTVPSPELPHPDGEPYFSGGYNLEQHSAFSGRKAWGIQVELPTGIREDNARRHAFATAFVKSALGFLSNTWE
ncbi:MAG: hypothetical protein NTZ35_20110 [Ignavibacteriales bacterium]|nr:hypothetical protein [Ignavibacteriales bacterium]